MENQPKKPQIMMPAIYKLETNSPRVNQWGWHKASELLEALQSILQSQRKQVLTADEICAKYPHLHPNKLPRDASTVVRYASVKADGVNCFSNSSGDDWLQRHADKGDYLPAKIGIALIKAIKHPVLDRLARVLP